MKHSFCIIRPEVLHHELYLVSSRAADMNETYSKGEFYMQKKIIAVAVAAALGTPGLSFAVGAFDENVVIYGAARVSYDLLDNGNGTVGRNGAGGATNGTTVNKVSSNTSKIGFKGKEDLGDGLYSIWQIESQVNLDDATTSPGGGFGTRNTYGGLTSDHFGTIRLGRYDTPYKVSTRKFDLFGDTLFDTRALTGGAANISSAVAFDGRPTNTVNYLSPSFNGFTVNAAYAAEAEGVTNSSQTKGKLWSIAGTYDASPFYATLAYEEHDFGTIGTGGAAAVAGGATGSGSFGATQNGAPAGSKEKATKVGLGYDIDAFNFGFAYEKTSDDEAAGGADRFGHNTYYLSGKYTFGTDALRVAYTKAGQVGSITNSEAKLYSIGYDHNLSKRTTLYAAYGALKNGSGINYPLTFANGTGANASSAFGAKVSGLSFGMNHAF